MLPGEHFSKSHPFEQTPALLVLLGSHQGEDQLLVTNHPESLSAIDTTGELVARLLGEVLHQGPVGGDKSRHFIEKTPKFTLTF